MKTTTLFILILASFSAMAGVSEEVFIRGKIGSDFDEKNVKVIDSFGQSYYLGKHNFPEKFKFKQGEPFAFEISEKELANVKVTKSK